MPFGKRFVLFLMFAVTIGYLGFLVFQAFSASAPSTPAPVYDGGEAIAVAHNALEALSSTWDETNLEGLVRERERSTNWYLNLKSKLPIYREDLGALVQFKPTVQDLTAKLNRGVPIADVTANCTHTKGTSRSRVLLANDRGQWVVVIWEISVTSTPEKPERGANGT